MPSRYPRCFKQHLMTHLSAGPAGTRENNNLPNCKPAQDTFSQVNTPPFRSILIRYLPPWFQRLHLALQGSIKPHIRANRTEKQTSTKKINGVNNFSREGRGLGLWEQEQWLAPGFHVWRQRPPRQPQVRLGGSPLPYPPESGFGALQGDASICSQMADTAGVGAGVPAIRSHWLGAGGLWRGLIWVLLPVCCLWVTSCP